jgi:hypothetical protein
VHRSLWVGLVLLLAVVHASRAWAAPAERVALGGSGPDAQLTRQLRVELAALGFEVVMIDDLGKVDLSAEVLKLTRDEDLLAVIRASSDGSRLEVWAADAEAGIYVTRGIDLARSGGSPRIIALRAVELLRAGLREIEARRQLAKLPPPSLPPAPERPPVPLAPPPSTTSTPPDAARRPPIPAARYALGASVGMLASAGGVPNTLTVTPSAEIWITSDWGLVARGFLPLQRSSVSTAKGSTDVGVFLGMAGVAYRLRPPPGKWQFQVEAGGGGALLRTEGAARANFVGTTDVATSPTAYASLGFSYEIVPDVAIGAAFFLGATFPRTTIAFAKEPVAHWGAPYGAGAIGAAFRFR